MKSDLPREAVLSISSIVRARQLLTARLLRRLSGVLGGLLLTLMYCMTVQAQTQAPLTGAAAPLRVVASFSILADMVRSVGGEDIHLDVLVGPLREAHVFEPGPSDVRTLGAAQVLIVNGLGFESWMPRLLEASGFQGETIVASRGVTPRRVMAGEETEAAPAPETRAAQETVPEAGADSGPDEAAALGQIDPHAWQDLANGVQYVQNIAQGLADADPAHASAYFARADELIRAIRKTDAQWRRELAQVPEQYRVLATSHDAFGYLGDAYGIRILSLMGVSSEAEPSARAMADLLNQIRTLRVRAIFLEQGSNSRALQQLATESGVSLGGTLYADTLDKAGQPAAGYLGMFRWNTRQLLQAMLGEKADG